jgi:small GTP-binding protein
MLNGETRAMKKKICLIGDSRVGKTSLLERFIKDEFYDRYTATISAKMFKKELQVTVQDNGNTSVVNMFLTIWDLIGHRDQEYWALLKRYIMNTDGIILVCDLTTKESLDDLNTWISSVFNTIGVIPFIVMANKSDLVEQVDYAEQNLNEFTKKYNSDYYYTSAKTGANVIQSFQRLCEIIAHQSIRIGSVLDPQEVLKEIVAEYCLLHGGQEQAMPIIKHQFKVSGADMNSPTKESLLQVIERLTQVTMSFKGQAVAREEKTKYLRLVNRLP